MNIDCIAKSKNNDNVTEKVYKCLKVYLRDSVNCINYLIE